MRVEVRVGGEFGSVKSNLERHAAKTVWFVSPGATVAKVTRRARNNVKYPLDQNAITVL